jgi:hypothetical protein
MPTTMDTVKLWYTFNGQPADERVYPEAASQTFKRGDLVYLVSGKVTVAAAVGNNVGAIKILGIALRDATGTVDNLIPVALATEDLRWVLPVGTASGATGSGATYVQASDTAVQTDMGVKVELTRNGNGAWCLDTSATTNAFMIPTKIHEQYGVFNTNAGSWTGVGSTESFGWYECKFNPALVDMNV